MHHPFSAVSIFLLLVCSVTAQSPAPSPTSSVPECPAQNILEACVRVTNDLLDACEEGDWTCLCAGYTNVATCYNNCPADPGRASVDGQRVANCNAASGLSSSTPIATPEPTTESASATAEATAEATKSATPTESNAAAIVGANAELGIVGAFALTVLGYLI